MASPRPAPPDDVTACPVCGAPALAAYTHVHGFAIARCPGCGLRRVDPVPEESAVQAIYGADYFDKGGEGYRDYLRDEPTHRRIARQRLAALRRLQPGGRLLDVGCAAGFFLDEARSAGFEPRGSELCPEMAAIARERFGLEVHTGSFCELEPSDRDASDAFERFDAITFYNVLAHFRDPTAVLAKARALLSPRGLLVVETWDADSPVARLCGRHWPLFTPPSVIHYLGRITLPRLLERASFQMVRATHGHKQIALSAGLEVLRHKYAKLPLARLAGLVERSGLGDRVTLPFGLGQLLTVFARPRPARAAAGDPRA